MAAAAVGEGTRESPGQLATSPGSSADTMFADESAGDLHATLSAVAQQKPAAHGTVEAWGRSPDNPVGGWYGLKKGLSGRFGMDRMRARL